VRFEPEIALTSLNNVKMTVNTVKLR
jgi:hypothetical protein